MTDKNNKKTFVDRPFEEVQGGYYESDFYYTPEGSKIYFLSFKVSGMIKDIISIVKDTINTMDIMMITWNITLVKDGMKSINVTLLI